MRHLALAALLLAHPAAAQGKAHLKARERRVQVVLTIWRHYRPCTEALARFFIAEHERAGLPTGTFWFSLTYAASGSDFNPSMRCSGGGMTSRGVMDCTQLELRRVEALRRFGTLDLHDTRLSIANHCAEAAGLHRRTGRSGWALMRAVFLPRSPNGRRAYQEQRRWERIEQRHILILKEKVP